MCSSFRCLLVCLKLRGRRTKAAALDPPPATTTLDPTKMWEWCLEEFDKFDNYCCIPLFCGADDNGDARTEMPSEIYVHIDTAKNLHTA